MQSRKPRLDVAAASYAGLAAGVVSTLAQVALWAAFTDALPSILFRDARLAAAIVLGEDALRRPDHDALVLVLATLVHFALSVAFALAIACLLRSKAVAIALVIGVAAGAALYALNMYVMTTLWPWFAAARDPITLAAHIVFGASAALAYRALRVRRARTRSA